MANNRSRDDVDVMLRSLGLVDFDYVDERPSDAPWRPQDGKSAHGPTRSAAEDSAEKTKASTPPPAPAFPRRTAPAAPAKPASATLRPRTPLASPARPSGDETATDDMPLSTVFSRLEGAHERNKPKLRLNLGAKRAGANGTGHMSDQASGDLKALFARAESAGTAPARRFLPTRKR